MREKLRYLSHNLASHSIYRNELLGEGSVLGFRGLLVLRFRLLQKSVCQKGEEWEGGGGGEEWEGGGGGERRGGGGGGEERTSKEERGLGSRALSLWHSRGDLPGCYLVPSSTNVVHMQ